MISLEQVQLLETRVARAIEFVQRVTSENSALVSEREGLQLKLNAHQKRINELEMLVMRFKEDQGRIEDGVIAALNRLSQFEEAFENSLKDKVSVKKPAIKEREKQDEQTQIPQVFFEIPEGKTGQSSVQTKETGKEIQLNSEPEDGQLSADGELDIF